METKLFTSKYNELRTYKPKLEIKKDAKEVVFKTVSCMCDNVHYISFKKNENGEFKMSGGGSSLSNWQMKHQIFEIVWEADEQNWTKVIEMINSGTAVIENVKSR